MTTSHHEHLPTGSQAPAIDGRLRIAAWMVAAVVGFYLLREHWDRLAGNWLYLLLLACPLMHLFHGHRGRGGHGASSAKPVDKEE